MGLLERCEELFKTSNLYEVLGVTKEASDAEVRRGYYKLSLQVHPDRAQGDELATEKFQVTLISTVCNLQCDGVCIQIGSLCVSKHGVKD